MAESSRKSSSILHPLSLSFQRALEKEKQSSLLKLQKEKYASWRKQELKYLGKFLMIFNFLEHTLDRWENADFLVRGEYDISCDIISDWESAVSQQPSLKGYEVSNKIIKPNCKIHLRSLACDVKIKLRLKGDSSLFIISRNNGYIQNVSPVIKLTRDTSLKGLFAMFGNIDQSNQKFTYYKQVQIPEDNALQAQEKNYRDLEVTFSDNGDDRVYLSISSTGKYNPITNFVTFCDFFLPYFEKSCVLIGGSGDSVLLKSVSIQQRERNNKLPERNPECCCRVF